MVTKFYSVPLVVDFPQSWFLVPSIFWQANPFLSDEETEFCCTIHKWSSKIWWILFVVQVVRQSLLGYHNFAIWMYPNSWLPSESSCFHTTLIMHWMTNRNRRLGVAIVKENCFQIQLRRVYTESRVHRIVINNECLHQVINISKNNNAPFYFKELH